MVDQWPDYELIDRIALTSTQQVRAVGHPLRTAILQLLHERAATVTELAAAIERPKGTIAHHVDVLVRAGLVRVVRTRKVRAIEERFYGRTARLFFMPADAARAASPIVRDFNDLELAAKESAQAYEGGAAVGLLPARSHLRRAGIGVLGTHGCPRGGVRPPSENR